MENWVFSYSQEDFESADDELILNGSRPDNLSLVELYSSYCDRSRMTDQLFDNFPSPSMAMATYTSNLGKQLSPTFSSSIEDNVMTGSDENYMVQPMDVSLYHKEENYNNNNMIPRSLSKPLTEKIIKALTLFKGISSNGGILAQLWAPIMKDDCHVLSTHDQPYLLDQALADYREVSRKFTFPAEVTPGHLLGLPGRVFNSKVPEWTSNVAYYSKEEYLRVEHAVYYDIRGSIAIPVFQNDPNEDEDSCCAVLELVTMIDKTDFEQEMENVCRALEAVDLKSTSCPRFHPQLQCLSNNQRATLAEITDVVRTVCHYHKLPLALTWIPCNYSQGIGYESTQVQVRGCNPPGPNIKSILCVEDSACYVYDKDMQGFLLACEEHYLEEGQGAAGKALQSIHPYFSEDVKNCSIYDYPLVHHARKFNLHSAVAIRLRSIFTGDEDYILEFFLPVDMKEDTEQQVLLNSIAGTMQRICKNLRTVSDPDKENLVTLIPPSYGGGLSSVTTNMTVTKSCPDSLLKVKKGLGKKRNNAEKSISLDVLKKHFSGSLKDSAKILGVCPTTLKRICRQYGIARWPSRKINKVNNSLKKMETVMNSVQGVEGSFKFNTSTVSLVAARTMIPTQEPADSSSGMTSSSNNGSGSTGQVSSSSTQTSFGERQTRCCDEGGSKITVKATYKEDTIRFKFDTAVARCDRLYEEIAMRFKLLLGTFHLKYLDDDEEWVMLINDSDLKECLDILHLPSTRTVKFLVAQTSCFLTGLSQ